jgi:hypothetical protein
MRYVLGTFDAPVPAAAGVRALELAGVVRRDIRMIDPSDVGLGEGALASGPLRDLLAADDRALLGRLGGAGRTTVIARVPTARAGAAAAALRAVGAGGVTESATPRA